jgi:hypothetical protein
LVGRLKEGEGGGEEEPLMLALLSEGGLSSGESPR